MKSRAPRVGSLLAASLCLAIAATETPAQGRGSAPPPGTIYFTHAGRTWTMAGDGSAKTMLPAGVDGEPSRLLHGGRRWFVATQQVGGTYPNGAPRVELFSVRDDALLVYQLTSQPDLQAFAGVGAVRWSPGDAMISWIAGRWSGGSLGDGGVYAASVVFDGTGSPVGLASQPIAPLVPCAIVYASGLRPKLLDHDWSPNSAFLVLDLFVSPVATPFARQLLLHDVGLAQTQTLPTANGGSSPVWSPDGGRIAFVPLISSAEGGVSLINPDGTGETAILKPHSGLQNQITTPAWSLNGQHVLYQKWGSVSADDRVDVYRAKTDGSGKTNLTADLDTRALSGNRAQPVGWR